MPLSEVSGNIQRSASTIRSTKSAGQDGPPQKATKMPSSRALQGMLRTTTELGDLGQFSVRPPRVPRSGSRIQLTRPRSGSFDSSFASALRHHKSPPLPHRPRRHHGPRATPSLPGLSSQATVRSNLTSYHQNSRPRRRGDHRHHVPGLEGLASPSTGPRGLYSHRSLMTLRSQRDFNSMYSNSPLVYPARSRRSGRAASPAFSDAQYYMRQSRPRAHRDMSVATAASSPASAFPNRHGIPGYYHAMNNSFTSVLRLPSPAIPGSYYAPARSPFPSRTTTPLSALDPRAQSNGSLNSAQGFPRSPTGSTTPYYYDYTEPFAEEDCFSPDADESGCSLPFNMDQTILENGPVPTFRHAQTPFGTMPGSSFTPAELPTKHNRRLSEESVKSLTKPERKSNQTASMQSEDNNLEISKVAGDGNTNDVEFKEDDADHRRASVASRLTCASSHSSTFFPNTSRSPRDLITLAARVHSPQSKGQPQTHSGLVSKCRLDRKGFARDVAPISDQRNGSPDWQLPSLNFRPLSLGTNSRTSLTRPRTSGGSVQRTHTEIVSPTPERPMSSQSRKRFSKILDMNEEDSTNTARPDFFVRSYNSMNASTSRKLEGIPESTYPLRLSIPPFTPQNDGNQDVSDDQIMDIVGAYADTRSSQSTSLAKSTIESLLDRHIEGLGLRPENAQTLSPTPCSTVNLASSTNQSRFLISNDADNTFDQIVKRKHRPATSMSWKQTSFANFDQQNPFPRRLFSSFEGTRPTLPSVKTVHRISSTSSSDRITGDRSLGWETLASTSNISSTPRASRPSLMSGELADVSDNVRKFKLKSRSGLISSPSSSSRWSQESEELTSQVEAGHVHRSLRSDLARQASHRRKMRLRMSIKRESRSFGDLADLAIHAARDDSSQEPRDLSPTDSNLISSNTMTSAGNLPELSGECVQRQIEGLEKLGKRVQERRLSTPPRVPTRWSSILAIAHEPVKRSFDVHRKASVRTIRSNKSNASLAEPVNSTRQCSQTPRLGSIPRLAPPEFGPPLSDLNLSIPYAEVPSTIRPTLRETKSFFSDDSSARQNTRGSFKKKFNLHSLRNVVAVSPRGVMNGTTQSSSTDGASKLNHSCQTVLRKSGENNIDSTVAMSDFAYRKRKVIEKFKEWWKRQCIHNKVGTRKKKAAGGLLV